MDNFLYNRPHYDPCPRLHGRPNLTVLCQLENVRVGPVVDYEIILVLFNVPLLDLCFVGPAPIETHTKHEIQLLMSIC